ncbi:MAG TPA: FkbM family methyltransferase, partial [Bacteroidia bacterium]|nr:FkbM family methyltransferase [Bacteroidia bacterium]
LALDRRKSDYLFFIQTLPHDVNILIVGACTGITTVPLARNPGQRIIFAYEPEASNFRVLNRVIAHYSLSNIRAYPCGLGSKQEQRELILPVVHGVRKQGMAHIMDTSLMEYNSGNKETILLDTLDNREELKETIIGGMKLVAENFEFEILEGGREFLLRNKPLIYCELWNNEKRKPVLELIRRYGYSIYFRKGNQLTPYVPGNYTGKNFFFKPDHE